MSTAPSGIPPPIVARAWYTAKVWVASSDTSSQLPSLIATASAASNAAASVRVRAPASASGRTFQARSHTPDRVASAALLESWITQCRSANGHGKSRRL